jgi:hypothetical protein
VVCWREHEADVDRLLLQRAQHARRRRLEQLDGHPRCECVKRGEDARDIAVG